MTNLLSKLLLALFLTTFISISYAEDPVIKDTTINKINYKIYKGGRGGLYIFVTSKSGKIYKKYLKTN